MSSGGSTSARPAPRRPTMERRWEASATPTCFERSHADVACSANPTRRGLQSEPARLDERGGLRVHAPCSFRAGSLDSGFLVLGSSSDEQVTSGGRRGPRRSINNAYGTIRVVDASVQGGTARQAQPWGRWGFRIDCCCSTRTGLSGRARVLTWRRRKFADSSQKKPASRASKGNSRNEPVL